MDFDITTTPRRFNERYGIEGRKNKENERNFFFFNLAAKIFLSVGTSKEKMTSFFRRFFSILFLDSEQIFQIFFEHFFSFFILLHVKLSSLSMGVPLAEKSHKPIFLKSCDGCPEFENLRNKNIFGLEDFSGPKKSEYFVFFIFRKKKHYTVPIGGLWPEIK